MDEDKLKQWLERRLRDAFHIAESESLCLTLDSIGSDKGYMSNPYRIHVESTSPTVPKELFMKVQCISGLDKWCFQIPTVVKLVVFTEANCEKVVRMAHNAECEFYSLFRNIAG